MRIRSRRGASVSALVDESSHVCSCSLSCVRADYIKVDGCGDPSYYPSGYSAMGAALESTGRDIAYSCSWPAYIGMASGVVLPGLCDSLMKASLSAGDNETEKPFGTFIMDGCNLWRNW